MKQILAAVMLILVILVIYSASIGGEEGMRARVRGSGNTVGDVIESIDP
ncbi:hypothetical protein [Paenibacillus koleovorans]|nr:hypothetical protein [Paenibacillus koleovorans]